MLIHVGSEERVLEVPTTPPYQEQGMEFQCTQFSIIIIIMFCKKAAGRSIRHHALNELVARALSAAAIPNTKEPQGLCRSDGKRPDGLTLVPWHCGRAVDLLFGTSQLSVPWQTLMLSHILEKLGTLTLFS